jgi:uncharacterized protein (AIM24 family)
MIAHKLRSSGQLLIVQLDGGQAVWCQPGRFVWKTPNVTVQARMIGPGGVGGGLLDRALATAISAGRRRLAGDAAALPYFSASGSSGLVAFAGDAAGPVQELMVEPDRGWLVARGALVAAERTVGLAPQAGGGPSGGGLRSPQRPTSGLERLDGSGSAFVTGAGGLVELDLSRYGGTIEVDPERLVAVQHGIRIEPHRKVLASDELLALVLGGGRPSLTTLSGDGTVLLRSLPSPVEGFKPATPTQMQGGADGIPG